MANRGHGKNGQFIRTLDSAERDAEAGRLRSLGHGYAEIAATMGYSTASGAWKAVARALAGAGGESREMARRVELDRIDRLMLKVQEILEDPGPLVDRAGHVVVDEESGERVLNREIQLHAVDRATRLLERRARVLGTDAPKRALSVRATLDAIPPEDIAAVVAELRAESGQELSADERTALMLPPRKVLPGAVEPA